MKTKKNRCMMCGKKYVPHNKPYQSFCSRDCEQEYLKAMAELMGMQENEKCSNIPCKTKHLSEIAKSLDKLSLNTQLDLVETLNKKKR